MLQEIKDKISKKMMGENNPFYNKTHTKETREHLSRIKYKKVGKFDLKGNLLGEFESLKSAQESMPIGNIGDCCRGLQRTAGGFVWKYI